MKKNSLLMLLSLMLYCSEIYAQMATLLKDINLGTGSGINAANDFSYSAGNITYFVATDNGTTYELWKTDGTIAGTIKLSNQGGTSNGIGQWNAINGKYVFSMSNSNTVGRELYVTDGTLAGTSLLKNINAGAGSGINSSIDFSYSTGSTMYFVATNNGTTYELWTTDGTTAGTIKLTNQGGTSNGIGQWNAVNGKYVFSMSNSNTVGRELYVTDGTLAGTSLLKNINAGAGSGINTSIDFSYSTGSAMYFVATDNGTTYELWTTDGTTAGTIKLTNQGGTSNGIGQWNAVNGKFVFSMSNSSTVGRELYVTDGTLAGTSLLSNINAGAGSGINTSIDFSYSNGSTMYFVATNNGSSYELWKTDGTTAGTIKLTNQGGTSNGIGQWNAVNGKYVFSMSNSNTVGRELYVTDGTLAGTSLLSNINAGAGSGINTSIDFSYSTGSTMYFVATNNGSTYELWKTDGTTAGTIKLTNQGGTSNGVGQWNEVNGKFVFSMSNSNTVGRELYVTDGTLAGTSLLKNINAGTGSGINTANDFSYSNGSTMLFVATNNGTNYELWKTDGTAIGTVKASNIGGTSNGIGQWNLVNGNYIFSMSNPGTYGREIWVLTGIATTAEELTSPFAAFPYPNPFNDKLYIRTEKSLQNEAYKISDNTGRIVLSGYFFDNENSIQVNTLSSGLYFLELGEPRKQTFKVVKK